MALVVVIPGFLAARTRRREHILLHAEPLCAASKAKEKRPRCIRVEDVWFRVFTCE